jgi:hypothetical protein
VFNLKIVHFSDRFGREIICQPTNSESCASINSTFAESNCGDVEKSAGKKNAKFIGPAADVALLRYVENISCVEGVRQKFHVSDTKAIVIFLFRMYSRFLLILSVDGN